MEISLIVQGMDRVFMSIKMEIVILDGGKMEKKMVKELIYAMKIIWDWKEFGKRVFSTLENGF